MLRNSSRVRTRTTRPRTMGIKGKRGGENWSVPSADDCNVTPEKPFALAAEKSIQTEKKVVWFSAKGRDLYGR